jgi:hypothetical protein
VALRNYLAISGLFCFSRKCFLKIKRNFLSPFPFRPKAVCGPNLRSPPTPPRLCHPVQCCFTGRSPAWPKSQPIRPTPAGTARSPSVSSQHRLSPGLAGVRCLHSPVSVPYPPRTPAPHPLLSRPRAPAAATPRLPRLRAAPPAVERRRRHRSLAPPRHPAGRGSRRRNPSPPGGLQCRAASEHRLPTRVDLQSVNHREA